MILFTAMLLTAASAIAQSENYPQDNDVKKMAPRMKPFTVEDANTYMAQELHLNEKQLKKVKKLNKKYTTLIEGEKPKMLEGMVKGGIGGGKGFQGGGAPGGGPNGAFPGGGPNGGGPGGGPNGGGPGGGPNVGGFPGHGPGGVSSVDYDAQQKSYDKKLKKILNEEQYSGYLKIRPKYYSVRRLSDFLFGNQNLR